MQFASKTMRRGFTIVELMMVIAIIGILLGIVTSAASSSIKQARVHKANTVCTLVEQAFATYYAQFGKWPGSVGNGIKNGNYSEDKVFSVAEVDEMMVAVIKESAEGNPLMDVSGLYVSSNGSEPQHERCPRCHGQRYYPARNARGLDFIEALRGTKQHPDKMKVRSMHFGYPHADDGGFMPFRVEYHVQQDKMTVSQWHWEK